MTEFITSAVSSSFPREEYDENEVSPLQSAGKGHFHLPRVDAATSFPSLSLDGETFQEALRETRTRRLSAWDKRDMKRLGRTQSMRRSYRTLSMLSFTVVVQATWEFVLV